MVLHPIHQQLQQRLEKAFTPAHLELVNESDNHSVPRHSATHFKAIIVSTQFAGQSLVQRHRLVNTVVEDLYRNPIHALAIHAYTPDEWQGRAHDSPKCRGGSGK